jgi:hypothetical protein
VVLQAAGVALEQQRRDAGVGDLIVDGAGAGPPLAREPVLLPIEHYACPQLEDVRGLGEQPGVLGHLDPPAAGHEHDLGAHPRARLDGAHA